MEIAKTPTPPYYAVVFTSQRTDVDSGYNEMSNRMFEIVRKQPGFLRFESVTDGIVSETPLLGITVYYWKNVDSMKNWKENSEHIFAQESGKEKWYQSYKIRICKIERDYEFDKEKES